ncbi:MAG: hypothetical protein WB441_03615 [Nocardioidaceae bacterium]
MAATATSASPVPSAVAGRPVRRPTARPRPVSWPVLVAVCLSVEAALIHLWYVPEALMEWWGYGAFFMGCAAGQAAFGPVLLRWRHPVVVTAGIWANAVVVALYVQSRLWGVPVGPHEGAVEAVGLFDLAAVVAETGLIVVLVTLLPDRLRSRTLTGLMVLGLGLWLLRLAVGPILP